MKILKTAGVKLLAILLCVFMLTSCGTNSSTGSNSSTQAQSNSQSSSSSNGSGATNTAVLNAGAVTSDLIVYDQDDYYTDWESTNPNYIKLNGSTASVTGTGASVSGSEISITASGVYVLSGSLDDGQLIVDVQDKGTVRLVLNEASITNSDGPAIYVKNAGKTVVSLPAGTQNNISDGEKYAADTAATNTTASASDSASASADTLSDADTSSDGPNAAIYCKDSLTINGTGTLTVNGKYNNGIVTKDDLKITSGVINVKSADDGIIGRDMVLVKDGSITVDAGGDGIKSTNDTGAGKGFVAVEGGKFSIKSGTDAIQGATSVLVANGDFTLSAGGGSANGTVKTNEQWGKQSQNTNTQSSSEKQSTKGIKAGSDITISGGTFNIDSADDSIHSNNSVNISGGNISISSGAKGIHADSSVKVKNGKINITKSFEGVESTVISVNGGNTSIVSSDDGFNCSDSSSGSSGSGGGQNSFAVQENCKLTITGGYIYVNASGDGLDSNGSVAMSGGTVVVSGPTENNNGALDYNGTFELTGGFLIAAGSSGMLQAPSDDSTQYSISMTYSSTQQAGTIFNLKDSSGNTLVTFAPEKQYQAVVISSPELKKGDTYTIYSGGSSTGSELNGIYTNGTYQGSKVVDCKISSTVNWMNESGATTAKTNMGGPGGGSGGFGGGHGGGKSRG